MIEYQNADWRDIDRVFETMAGECPRTAEVMYLVARGDLEYRTVEWCSGEVSEDRREAHNIPSRTSGSESHTHLTRKIQLCDFFADAGFEVPTVGETDDGSVYGCLEEAAASVTADVAFDSGPGEKIVAEAGYTPAERVLHLFGFWTLAPPSDIEAIHDGDLHRKKATEVESVFVYPYNESSRLHVFSRTDEIAEPDISRLGDRVEDALDL